MTIAADSSHRGFVQDTGPEQLEDPELTDLLSDMIVGVVGMSSDMVRPRWQTLPPNQPTADINWCSIGIIRRSPIGGYPYIQHNSDAEGGLGTDTMIDWNRMDVLASFYGPGASGNAGKLRRGLNVGQNRDTLVAAGIKLEYVGDINSVPDLFNMQFIDHVDVDMTFVREVTATYKIRNIVEADVQLVDGGGLDTLSTTDQNYIIR